MEGDPSAARRRAHGRAGPRTRARPNGNSYTETTDAPTARSPRACITSSSGM